MSMWLLLGLVLAVYPVTIFILYLFETQQRRNEYRTLLKRWSVAPDGDRVQLIAQWLNENPRSGGGWYLQGVLDLRSGRTRQAARSFGLAHHCDANLISAAMFTFVCLKSSDRGGTDIQRLIENTWAEMKRPQLGQFEEERLIFSALADGKASAGHWTLEQVTNLVLSKRGNMQAVAETGQLARAI
jgi:hypothetical protein